MRILAIDDDPMILELLQSPMWLGGVYDLTCAASAEEALEIIAAADNPFDAFLVDIVMPGRDGINLCAALRAMPRYTATPIIMITASQAADAMERAFRAGATDFVRKPLDGLDLGARLHVAAMLNASVRRERKARAETDTLRRRAALGYDDSISAGKNGAPVPFLALQNALLELPAGCHALSLFAVRISPVQSLGANTDKDVVKRLHLTGSMLADCCHHANTRLAYAGRGLFVGATPGRRREKMEELLKVSAAALRDIWLEQRLAGSPPDLCPYPISTLGVWTGQSAVQALRAAVAAQPDPRFDTPETLISRMIGA
ncbi:response regulator [Loktanella sp. M215]|mgnify:CR=1 FL=1|uniref:response regulator n=1 Tax=Loktanella sp. M215 TaxID=2675431 RepID=UPI001F0000E2|nr:response regulator [Loktanella sp. M215]MBU2358276.1 response regulator [Alphaproteobacteria bacterium]MCF7698121.1 response regulator [Loktanella sp. M215]